MQTNMIGFLVFMILFHSMQFWLWRVYLQEHPDVFLKGSPSKFESMLFWPQFLGIMRGKKPKKENAN